ncbi:MAG: FAD:protein FMN transferase [bacterium]
MKPAAGRRRLFARALAACALVALLSPGCRRADAPAPARRTRLLMNTYVTLTAAGPAADRGIEAAFRRLEEINRAFNFRDSTSPLWAFNREDRPFVDAGLAGVIRAALEVSAASGGAFDVTVQPLVALWGIGTDRPAVPGRRALDSARALVGWQYLVVAGDSVAKRRPGLRVDLGGIAKGYALAEAARVLRAEGVRSGLVDAGGDVYAIGRKAGAPWRVGIRSPRGGEIIAVVRAEDLAVVSSGDYERFFTDADGSTYCHIFDPRTARPARALAGVTVVAADPVLADAWATALFVLGPSALELVEATDGIEALFVTPGLELTASSGLAPVLELPGR